MEHDFFGPRCTDIRSVTGPGLGQWEWEDYRCALPKAEELTCVTTATLPS
jgi:hypothetical protein